MLIKVLTFNKMSCYFDEDIEAGKAAMWRVVIWVFIIVGDWAYLFWIDESKNYVILLVMMTKKML